MPQQDHSLSGPYSAARSHRLRAARLGGLAWVGLVVSALLVGRGLPTRWAELSRRSDVPLEDGVTLLCQAGLVLLLLWLALLLLSSTLELVAADRQTSAGPGRGHRPEAATPAPPRRGVRAARTTALLLALTAGVGVSTASAAPSGMAVVQAEQDRQPARGGTPNLSLKLSAPSTPAPATAPAPGSADVPMPGWTPERPVGPTRAAEQVRLWGGTRTAGEQPATVVVHRGDDLWSIVARHLGPSASAGRIAEEVPRWHAANRAVIGSDPDLLLVGQVLTAPGQQRSAPEPPPVRLPSFSGQRAGA